MFVPWVWGLENCGVLIHDHGLVTSLQLQTTRPQTLDLHGFFIRLTAKQMKTFSAAYLLFVTTAIAVLFTVPPWVLPESNPESPLEGFGIQILVGIGHGMSICLFFHLITKGVGLSLGWRIFLNAAIPVAIYMSIMLWALQYMSNGILRFAPFMLGFYTVKFLTCSVMAEYTMLDLQRRFKWFGTAPLPPGG